MPSTARKKQKTYHAKRAAGICGWYGCDKLAPCGIDASTLKVDLAKLGGGILPPIDPPVPPTPTPPVPVPPPYPPPTFTVQLPHIVAGTYTRTGG